MNGWVIQSLDRRGEDVPAVVWLSRACQWRADAAGAFLFSRKADAVRIARRLGGMVARRSARSFFPVG